MSEATFPEFHFPCQSFPNKERVKLPAGYGCFNATNIDLTDKGRKGQRFTFQYHHGDVRERGSLVAKEPTVPLFMPNDCSSVPLQTLQDLGRVKVIDKFNVIEDRAVEQVTYFYRKFPKLAWGSALEFLGDSYQDRFDYKHTRTEKFRRRQKAAPVLSLSKMKSEANLPKLLDRLDSSIYDVNPNMLLSLLKEEFQDNMEKQYIDQDFYGGCLAYQNLPPSSGHEGLLLYPSGPTLEVLNVQALPLQRLPIYSTLEFPKSSFAVSAPLRQIEAVGFPYRESIMAGIRTNYTCCMLNLTPAEYKVKAEVANLIHSQQKIASVALSPYIFGECVMGLDTGGVQLAHPERGPVICIKSAPSLESESPSPCRCHYAAHPRLFVTQQRKSIDLVDTRTPVGQDSCLLSLESKTLPKNQVAFVAKQHPSNQSYHFVATQDLMLLLDERFPNYAVLQWCHSLQTPPNYMDIVPHAVTSDTKTSPLRSDAHTDDLILVASQGSREVHCFQCNDLNGQTPESTSLPWKVSSTEGWLDMLPEYPEQNLDPIRTRLQRSLIGVSAAKTKPWEKGRPGVTVFQLTAAGDIFYQVFSQKDRSNDRKDKTVSVGPGCPSVELTKDSWMNCKEWIASVLRQQKSKAKKSQTSIGFEAADVETTIDVFNSMTRPAQPDKACQICLPKDFQISRDSNLICPSCGIKTSDASQLEEHLKDVRRDSWHAQQSNLQKVSKPFKRRRGLFDDDGQEEDGLPWRIYPREYQDDMSRLLYKTWMHGYQDGTEEEVNDGVEYSQSQMDSTPFNTPWRRRGRETPQPLTSSQISTHCQDESLDMGGLSQTLDMSGIQRAPDSQRTPSYRLSSTVRKKKVIRTMMGF
ncbi:uncharacterized protein [Asterias amurensis]|uniref:uncharacterized protein n=1 Tax=Asterias amurensis TaxID=7602 RepID=UPI003AB80D5C